jgi:hypothetical protein
VQIIIVHICSLSITKVVEREETIVVVDYTGDVYYTWQEVSVITCPLDVRDFPYDTQTCEQIYVPWMITNTGVNLIAGNESSMEYFRPNMGNVQLLQWIYLCSRI